MLTNAFNVGRGTLVRSRSRQNLSWLRTSKEMIRVARAASPIAAIGLLNLSMSLTDIAMIAHLDRSALAAGAIVSDSYSILLHFSAGAVSAVAPLIAAEQGAGAPDRVGVWIARGLQLLLALAAMGFLIIFSIVDVFLSLGLEVPLADHAASYARYMAGAFVFMLLVALARNALAAIDRGDVPVWVMVAMVPLNAFGNAVFMYGLFGAPELGLAGAGAASLLVAAFAAASLSAYVLLSRQMLPFAVLTGLRLLASPPSWSLVRAGLLTGATSLCETGVYLSSTILMAAFAPEAVAAHAIVFRTLALTYVLVTGVGQAVTIRLAHALGSGRRSLQDGVVNASVLWVLLLLPTWMLVLNIGPAWALGVLQLGSSVEPLADLISGLSPLAGVAAAALAASVLAFGILRAHQDVLAPALLNLTGYWGIGFSLMVVLAGPAGYGATGVWTGPAVGSLATAAGSWLYVHARGHMRLST